MNQLDLLRSSHRHEDHWDPLLVEQALRAGVPVLCDEPTFPCLPALSAGRRALCPQRLASALVAQPFRSEAFRETPARGGEPVGLAVCPGHQGDLVTSIRSPT